MPKRRINPWSVWALVAIMLGGLLVYYNWLKTVEEQMKSGRPARMRPIAATSETDHRGDRPVLFNKDGKLYLVGYFYTGDREQAASVCRRMEAMRAPFAATGKVFLVGVTMAPAEETGEVLAAFAEANGFTGDEWIFISGNEERIRNYMNKEFRYRGRRSSPAELEEHGLVYEPELGITLVDGDSWARGVYWAVRPVGEQKWDARSEHDIRYILTEEMGLELPGAGGEDENDSDDDNA